jgi:hypothetical protein
VSDRGGATRAKRLPIRTMRADDEGHGVGPNHRGPHIGEDGRERGRSPGSGALPVVVSSSCSHAAERWRGGVMMAARRSRRGEAMDLT